MSTVQIYINKLVAKYSSSFHFKIKILVSNSPTKESVENKHSLKYDKDSPQLNIYEKLDLKTFGPLTSENKLHFFLEVYTKKGYKTAGVGILNLSKGVAINVPIKVEIKKCPLGKGYLEIQFLNLNINPTSKTPSKNNIIPLRRKISKDKLSDNSDNSYYSNNFLQNDISNISFATNLTNITNVSNDNSSNNKNKIKNNNQIPNNYNHSISPRNISNKSNKSDKNKITTNHKNNSNSKNFNNIPNIKLNTYNNNISPRSNHNTRNIKPISTGYNSKTPKSNSYKINNYNMNNNMNNNTNNNNMNINNMNNNNMNNVNLANNNMNNNNINNSNHINNNIKNDYFDNITSYNNNNEEIIKSKDKQINELKTKIDYYEEENNELKNLVNDFKKEKKNFKRRKKQANKPTKRTITKNIE